MNPDNNKKTSNKLFNLNNNSKYFQVAIIILFAIFISIGMYYHELWRDELEMYSRVAFTNNIFMDGDISYILYYFFIKLFMLVNNSETMFQIAHFIIIVAAVFLFIKFADISNLQKFLFTFSYFTVYEYGIISRYYAFMILLVFIIVYLITRKEKNYLIIVLLLLILANHSIQSTIFAASLSIYILLDLINSNFKNKIIFDLKLKSAAILFVAGWAVILLSHYFFTLNTAFYFGENGSAPLLMNIKSIWNAYIPVPDLKSGIEFWNTNIINYLSVYPKGSNISEFLTGPNIFALIISLLIVFIISIKFASKPIVLITFLINTIVYLAFLEMLKVYYIRYQGYLFVIFIYTYWLYTNTEEKANLKIFKRIDLFFNKKFFMFLKKGFYPLLYIILFFQLFSAIYAFSTDAKYKFSLSKDAASYISANKLNKTHVMIGFIDFATQSIAAHTKTKIFFPQVNHFNYYQEPFNKKRKALISFNDVMSSCIEFTEVKNEKVLLILNFRLGYKNSSDVIDEIMITDKTKLRFIKQFTGKVIQTDEQYWLYEATNITNG